MILCTDLQSSAARVLTVVPLVQLRSDAERRRPRPAFGQLAIEESKNSEFGKRSLDKNKLGFRVRKGISMDPFDFSNFVESGSNILADSPR